MFLSYASDDHALAERVSDALTQSGIRSANQVWETSPGEDLATKLREYIRASVVVVVLLPRGAAASGWFGADLELAVSRDLDRRGAELIPVLAADLSAATIARVRSSWRTGSSWPWPW